MRSADRRPIPDVAITVTGLQSRTSRTTRTNDEGEYTVLFGEGEGQYVITARMIGYAPATVRAIRSGQSSVVTADIVLEPVAATLDSVTVMAEDTSQTDADIGGNAQDALQGALFSLDPSDLTALAAAVPGVMAIPGVDGETGGYSVLGASPDQNSVLLDGSTFEGGALPPDAIASAQLATTTFDPARGNFAGGQMSITTRRGNDLLQGTARVELADPHLAWADPAAPTPISRNLGLSGGVSGPIKRGSAYFNLALSTNSATRDLLSLSSLDGLRLEQYGLSRDTIDALGSTLGTMGVPLTTDDIPDQTTSAQRSGLLRVDMTPSATTSLILTATASHVARCNEPVGYLHLPVARRPRRLPPRVVLAHALFIHALHESGARRALARRCIATRPQQAAARIRLPSRHGPVGYGTGLQRRGRRALRPPY